MDYSKTFWTIMLILFIIYISIFMASSNGYYEYENKNKTILTEEKMKEFEDDVANGKSVDLKNYFEDNNKNYENKITNAGNTISNIISTSIFKSLEESFKLIEKLVE